MPSDVMARLKLPQRRLTLKRHSELRAKVVAQTARRAGAIDTRAPDGIAQLHPESVSLLESGMTFDSIIKPDSRRDTFFGVNSGAANDFYIEEKDAGFDVIKGASQPRCYENSDELFKMPKRWFVRHIPEKDQT
jgi:hypothetical protein